MVGSIIVSPRAVIILQVVEQALVDPWDLMLMVLVCLSNICGCNLLFLPREPLKTRFSM